MELVLKEKAFLMDMDHFDGIAVLKHFDIEWDVFICNILEFQCAFLQIFSFIFF